jgi:hypothetical protein
MYARQTPAKFGLGEPFGQRQRLKVGLWSSGLPDEALKVVAPTWKIWAVMRLKGILLAMVFYVPFCGHALAWGDTAHQVICEIAFRLAQPATQAEITRLIVSDPAGVFPDFSESFLP